MTTEEIKNRVTKLQKYTKKVVSSSKTAKSLLLSAGICDKEGNLTKVYK